MTDTQTWVLIVLVAVIAANNLKQMIR